MDNNINTGVNPLWKILSDHKITDLNQADFVSAYSDKKKFSDVYNFVKSGQIPEVSTDLSPDAFYDAYIKKYTPEVHAAQAAVKNYVTPNPVPEKPVTVPANPFPGNKMWAGKTPTQPATVQNKENPILGNIKPTEIDKQSNDFTKNIVVDGKKFGANPVDLYTLKSFDDLNNEYSRIDLSDQSFDDIPKFGKNKGFNVLSADKTKLRDKINESAPVVDAQVSAAADNIFGDGSAFFKKESHLDAYSSGTGVEIDQHAITASVNKYVQGLGLDPHGASAEHIRARVIDLARARRITGSKTFEKHLSEELSKRGLSEKPEYAHALLSVKESQYKASLSAYKTELEQKVKQENSVDYHAYKEAINALDVSTKTQSEQLKLAIDNDHEIPALTDELYKKEMSIYQAQVDSGNMSLQDANSIISSDAFKHKINDQVNAFIHQKYGAEFKKLSDQHEAQRISLYNAYADKTAFLNRRANDQFNSRKNQYIAILENQQKNGSKMSKQYEEAYKAAYDKTAEGMHDVGMMTGNYMGATTFLSTAFSSAMQGLSSFAYFADAKDAANYLDDVSNSFMRESEEWHGVSGLLRNLPSNFGNFVGSSLSSYLPAAAAGLLTRNPSVMGRLLMAGVVADLSETPMILGEAERRMMSRFTRDENGNIIPGTGSAVGSDFVKTQGLISQMLLLPAYMIEGSQFIKGGINSIKNKALRTGANALAGWGSEFLQEYPQQGHENAYMQMKPIYAAYKDNMFPNAWDVALQVSPAMFEGSTFWAAKKVYNTYASRAAMAKANVSSMAPETRASWLIDAAFSRNSGFVKSAIGKMYSSGLVDRGSLDGIAEFAENIEQHLDTIRAAKANGANPLSQKLLANLLYQQSITPQVDANNKPSKEFVALSDKIKEITSGKNPDVHVVTVADRKSGVSTFAVNEDQFNALMNNADFIDQVKAGVAGVMFFSNDKAKAAKVNNDIHESIYGKAPVLKQETEESDEEFQKRLDKAAEDLQKMHNFDGHTVSIPDSVYLVLDRMDDGLPVDITAVEEASRALFIQYKQYEAMLTASSRSLTREQINHVMQGLEKDITRLENYIHNGGEELNTEASTEAGQAGSQVSGSQNTGNDTRVENDRKYKEQVQSFRASEVSSDMEEVSSDHIIGSPSFNAMVDAAHAAGKTADDVISDLQSGKHLLDLSPEEVARVKSAISSRMDSNVSYQDKINNMIDQGMNANEIMRKLNKSGSLDHIETSQELDAIEADVRTRVAQKAETDFIEENYRRIVADLKLKNKITTEGCDY